MKTPVLKRRLNPFLLATTVLVLSLLAGLSVMYQGQLSDILSDKNNLEDQLEDRNQEISNLESANSNLSQQIQEKDNRISKLASESSSLESEVNSLESDISTLESEISDKEDEIATLEDQKAQLEINFTDLNGALETICLEDQNNLTDDSRDECDDWEEFYR